MTARRTLRAGRSGMTLLELLLVMALIGVLMGAGVGLLSSLNLGERAAKGLVQSVIRAARNSAVARGAGARVRLDPNLGTIRAEALEVVGTWHFEGSGEVVRGAFEIDGTNLGAAYVDDGFVGRALGFQRGGRARVEIPLQLYSAYDFEQGFRVEFALRLEGSGGGRVLRIGETIGIDATDAGGLKCWFVPKVLDSTGREMKGGRISFEVPSGALASGVWRRVAFEYDRRALAVELDGVVVELEDEAPREGAPVWSIDAPLTIGDPQSGFNGSIDSLVLSAVAASEETQLPEAVRFDPSAPPEVRFDAGGNLDRSVHREPVVITLIYADGKTYPVRIGMYGTVE